MKKTFLFLALCLCLFGTAPAASAGPVRAVATFSILGDMVKNVGGDLVAVTVLVGPDADTHTYSPTPEDAKKVAQADLVVMNGLHLEGWIDRLVQASGCKAPVVIASAGITPLTMDDEDGGGAKVTDPHAWQDLENGMRYVENIRAGLCAADPAHAGDYAKNAEAYRAKLAAMHAWVRDAFARIPEARRKVITSHDAFGYLGHAYGVTLLSPMGVSTESEASAKNVAELIRQIKKEKVTALFVENMTDPRLMEGITRETGVKAGGELFSDALSAPDGPAPTYLDMFRHNVTLMTQAMAEETRQ